MALGPRYRRVAALERRFVNREGALDAFATKLTTIGEEPRVLNLVGVGGIGKSRLLRELQRRAEAAAARTAVLDLQVAAMRQHEDALAIIRTELGRKKVPFPRFDVAYAVLWQRLHPHLDLRKAELPFRFESEVLSELLDDATNVPIFGTALGLLKLLGRARSRLRTQRLLAEDTTLAKLDELATTDVLDAVTYLLAEDLHAASTDQPFVLFVDAYEALVPSGLRAAGRTVTADHWLRDLLGQLRRGLTVVASREPLTWAEYDPDWMPVIEPYLLQGLPMTARLELLAESSDGSTDHLQALADASQGLPYYLHLAIDTQTQKLGDDPLVVSSNEILNRFLEHVEPSEVRALELLGATARMFDYGIFQRLTQAFHLPSDRLRWDSLTCYSFVYPAGDLLRLHSLMATTLRQRLSPTVLAEAHQCLAAVWTERLEHATTEDSSEGDRALREACYHRLWSGTLTAEDFLQVGELGIRRGGRQTADGILADLREYLFTREDAFLADAALCLEAEIAILMGDAKRAVALTATASLQQPQGLVQARLAVAGAHARRIAGATADAIALYEQVWKQPDGPVRHLAGLWLADLHMCQGRLRTAFTLARELLGQCPIDAFELRADLLRLQHLGHRLWLNFDAARAALDQAEACYLQARSVVGLANIQTNRIELLAWCAPEEAVALAEAAISAQQDLGALHELGKTYTALAVAQTHTNDLDGAATSFETACSYLDRARYRSGRARAELFRALLHIRRNDTEVAAQAIGWAVEELTEAQVYPMLALSAELVLQRLGHSNPAVERAAANARDMLEPPDSLAVFIQRSEALLASMLGQNATPMDLYDRACQQGGAAAGYYNQNIRVETTDGAVNVRIPIYGAEEMDLRPWPEHEVLAAIAPYVDHVPKLLHVSADPPFQLHDFITGPNLNAVAPRGTPVPAHVLGDVVALLKQLTTVPRSALPPGPSGWPTGDDAPAFANKLSGLTAAVYTRFLPDYRSLFAELGFPTDPLANVRRGWETLTRRPLACAHADIHRKNAILHEDHCVFLDWELALWGDPVYDFAVHLHKMGYLPEERTSIEALWHRTLAPEFTAGWQADIETYLTHERIKSAIVDSVRYSQCVAEPANAPEPLPDLVAKLAIKLNQAHGHWGSARRFEQDEVAAALSAHAGCKRPDAS